MKFISQRLYHTKNNPLGDFSGAFISNGEGYNAFVVEDGPQPLKIAGKTRIPKGIYELRIREIDSPLTIKHRNSYRGSWFDKNPNWYHIELMEVPNFQYVYIHSGNDDSHTDACQLLNYAFNCLASNNPGSLSTIAVNDFYAIVYPLLKAGKSVWYEIRDEQ